MSVNDCMNEASTYNTAYSPEWNAFVTDCVETLCKMGVIDCD